jgi:predicted SpoU family rRNA methylase
MEMRKATRKKVKMKMSISAPTGFGKTYSALLLAFGITKDWSKICLIDTENGSGDLYEHLGDYNVISLSPPFDVVKLEKAFAVAMGAGIEVIIIDSAYHFWQSVLDYVDTIGGGFQNWKKGSPIWQKFINLILQSDVHVIATIRKKQAYVMTQGEGQQKAKVEKKGMEDQVRDGFDYEMTVAFDIITDNHLAKVMKDRTELFTGKQEFVITSKTGELIKEWCDKGVDFKPYMTNLQLTQAVDRILRGESSLIKKLAQSFAITTENETALKDAVEKIPPTITQF